MCGKPEIRLGDELLVEAILASAGLVTGHKHDRPSFGIEGEGGAPFAIRRLEAQLLHIGVLRALQRIRVRPSKLWTILGQQLGDGEQRVLDGLLKGQKLRLEGVMEFDFPSHLYSF